MFADSRRLTYKYTAIRQIAVSGMNLSISKGRFRRGEWVYTCNECGREGEREFMVEHLRLAHEFRSARGREAAMRSCPKRREYVNVREV